MMVNVNQSKDTLTERSVSWRTVQQMSLKVIAHLDELSGASHVDIAGFAQTNSSRLAQEHDLVVLLLL